MNDQSDPYSQHPSQHQPPPPPPRPQQGYYYGPPPGGAYGAPPPPPPPPPPQRPQVVQITSKPGGFSRAVGFVFGMILFAVVFCIGIGMGAIAVSAVSDVDSVVVRRTYREGNSKVVAIIPIEGAIDGRKADFVHAAVDNILKDSSVRAVVLRVDSPGGAVSPSDEIWNEVNRLKDHNLPVVASYGGVAASGGYYVSCGANYIMAEETCITGSIGVIAQILTFEDLLNKVGVKPVTLVASGSPDKDVANNLFRTWNEADKAKIKIMLDAAYTAFNKRVKDGRSKVIGDPNKVDALATGAIFTAQQAKDNGLVDGIGYLDAAIAQAESLGGIGTASSTVITIHQTPSLFRGLLAQDQASSMSTINADSIRGIVNELGSPRVMYLMQ